MTAVASRPESDQEQRDPRDPEVRLGQLLDPGSIEPLHRRDGSGMFAVRGRVDGTKVVVYCSDATKMGGALGAGGCGHIVDAIDVAVRERCPVIGVWHSGGARIPEGVESLDGMGRMFAAMIGASGRVPQISVVVGPAAGGAAYGPALTDVVIMSPAGRVFVTGPEVVRSVTGEEIDQEGLGGVSAHGAKSGVVHVVADDESDAYVRARRLTGLFAEPGVFDLRCVRDAEDLRALLPDRPQRAYDVKPVIRGILDARADGGADFEELQAKWAANIVVGLGRLGGRSIGVIANNPLRKGGCLDSLSAEKAARFVRMCDSFGVPLLVLVDVPGYLPGVGQEWGGVVRRGAKLLHAFGEAVVPRVTLVTRKSYGGAYIAMNARSLGATTVFAWPEAEVAVMGAKAAVGILHRKALAAAPEEEREALQARLAEEHERVAGGVGRAMSIGVVDEVIDPKTTRRRVAEALAAAPAGRGSHGNIPL
ncbi:acyl-CoA carboxylase subunit beta [Saccharopolyspora spinosa]|uniref:Acetyl-CoA/propionyl-CoA carboxylase carboxyl transferase subunit n=1 Tax=Saccharopolyspora spinosa TaxID=60894 RepID=A0A2N3XWG9_SACSN|nr:carboxyl transferase domain-containing protein [Saccharopolyspora spinosa]PKW15015.1 acetyl-CoA/propionyl-CoA carboxylase carboxyl transferase subunit [Saccharopolyspora spinosa]